MNRFKDKELTEKKQMDIIKASKLKARWNTILTILTIILIIVPATFFLSVAYYSVSSKANNEIIAAETIYSLTRPNLQIGDMEMESEITPFFGLHLSAPLYKQVGGVIFNAGDYHTEITPGNNQDVTEKLLINDIPMSAMDQEYVFQYPSNNPLRNHLTLGWEQLENVSEGTVSEAYLSLDKAYASEEIKDLIAEYDIDLVWNAVDTGVEKEMVDEEGRFVSPIGYPENNEAPANSNFESEDNQELFMEQLQFLDQHEAMVNSIRPDISMAAQERLKYLKENDIRIYGIVVTGPSKEILKMERQEAFKGIYIGETENWNWNKREGY
ncbi:MAG: anti-sigma factor C-terminal domain-containing protein [Bacillota bacterium]|uniref:anti-sigma factor C-terminal domain-containing protein n=1 Tax=unclassified Virgibacillus TaxID=2620237 RepID=UPI001D16D90D|nr:MULTISPECIES: anti-sigma factor C-terminal domain-containing protein [unclassified Virgibacillus]MCC2251464.1 anti-sigma factor C-terminal domain-containing protein [Virgibacillus sp. AGTR]MDY7044863.1 anti-sigma factor C-terminal domain-containing protein [Virgibacillus sp. M23]